LFGTRWDKTGDEVNRILVELEEDYFVMVSFFASKILASMTQHSSIISGDIEIPGTDINKYTTEGNIL